MEDESCSESGGFVYPINIAIPIDLFISRKRSGLTKRAQLTFTDSFGDLVYSILHSNHSSSKSMDLVDSSGNPLISFSRHHDEWQGYRGNSTEGKDLMFKVQRTFQSESKRELKVYLFGESAEDPKIEFVIKGSPFQRSCTIYQGNSIVAQTSLLYKLRTIFVGRRKFRVTIFPGFVIDHAFVATLIVIFFHGRI